MEKPKRGPPYSYIASGHANPSSEIGTNLDLDRSKGFGLVSSPLSQPVHRDSPAAARPGLFFAPESLSSSHDEETKRRE